MFNLYSPVFLRRMAMWILCSYTKSIKCFVFVCLMVFNATLSNISVISWRSVLLVEGTIDLPQVTDKLYHIMLYTSTWSRFEPTTSVVIGTDCNYHTITVTTAPLLHVKWNFICNVLIRIIFISQHETLLWQYHMCIQPPLWYVSILYKKLKIIKSDDQLKRPLQI